MSFLIPKMGISKLGIIGLLVGGIGTSSFLYMTNSFEKKKKDPEIIGKYLLQNGSLKESKCGYADIKNPKNLKILNNCNISEAPVELFSNFPKNPKNPSFGIAAKTNKIYASYSISSHSGLENFPKQEKLLDQLGVKEDGSVGYQPCLGNMDVKAPEEGTGIRCIFDK